MTLWDYRAMLRALSGALLGLLVVWLVTAASDEGQLTVGARAGRTIPLAPLCSAIGAALALGTARVRQESLAFEALGRSPAETGRAAAIGAAVPSVIVALAIVAIPGVDVAAFYPHAVRADTFTFDGTAFESRSLGVRIDPDGETHALEDATAPSDAELPPHARFAAGATTALAGLALALVAARATLRRSLLDARGRRRMRIVALGEGVGCAIFTLIAFQAAAARVAPAALAILPPVVLLTWFIARSWWGYAAVAAVPRKTP